MLHVGVGVRRDSILKLIKNFVLSCWVQSWERQQKKESLSLSRNGGHRDHCSAEDSQGKGCCWKGVLWGHVNGADEQVHLSLPPTARHPNHPQLEEWELPVSGTSNCICFSYLENNKLPRIKWLFVAVRGSKLLIVAPREPAETPGEENPYGGRTYRLVSACSDQTLLSVYLSVSLLFSSIFSALFTSPSSSKTLF